MSWLFPSSSQGIGASASASVLPMNIQGWFLLALPDLISLKCQVQFSSAQSFSRVWLFVILWTAACPGFLFITILQSLLKLTSIESMPSKHLILYRPLLLLTSIFPASGSFPMSQFFTSGSQSIGVSASTSVLPMNIQDWFPLGLTGLISLQCPRTLNSLLQHHNLKASIGILTLVSFLILKSMDPIIYFDFFHFSQQNFIGFP